MQWIAFSKTANTRIPKPSQVMVAKELVLESEAPDSGTVVETLTFLGWLVCS